MNKEDSPQNHFGSELAHNTDKEDATATHLENETETLCLSPNAFGSHGSPLDLKEDTHTVILRRNAETGQYTNAQYTQKVIQIRVTEFTVPGTVKKSGHERELKSNPSTKSKSVRQPIICKILDQTEDILYPLSQISNSTETQQQHSQDSSPADMLTSSVMAALAAPSSSARSRKQRQGVPDANLNTTEQEMHRRRQEVHSPSYLFSRDFPQHPFFRDPKLQTGDVFPEVSNKENAPSINGSKTSTDSRSNLFNLRNHGERRRLTRAFSAKIGGGQTDDKTEAYNPVSSPVETVLRPVSPHSLDLHWTRSASQPAQFSSMNSPPTTTGSLLLSFRKTNFSSSSSGTPTDSHPLSSTSLFNSQNKNVSRMSEPLSYVTLQRNRKKSHLSPSQPLSNTLNRPKGASEFFPLTAFPNERQHERLRPCMFLYPNNNIEISSPNTTPTTSNQGQTPISPLYNKLDRTKDKPLSPAPGSMLRQQHTLEVDSVLQSTHPRSFALRRTHTLSNVSDLLNNNNPVRTMLPGDSVVAESPAYSSGIYGGTPGSFNSVTSSNLNTLTSHTDAGVQGRGPQNATEFSIYTISNNKGIQQAKTVDIPTMSRRSRMASTPEIPQTDSPVSPRLEYSVRYSLRNSTNAATLVQQSSLNTPRPLFNRDANITDTQHYISSIDNNNRSPAERAAMSPLWQNNVEDLIPVGKQSQRQCESSDPLSPARSQRNICAPTTYSSLRCSGPASPTSSMPPSPSLVRQRGETPAPQSLQDRKMQSESRPVHITTTISSVRHSSTASPASSMLPPLLLAPQRRDTPATQTLQDRKMQSESSPVHIPTTLSSIMLGSQVLHNSPTLPSSPLSQRRDTAVSPSLPQDGCIQIKLSKSSPTLTQTPFSSVMLSSPVSHTSPTLSSSLHSQRREIAVSPSLPQGKNIQLSESNPAHISSPVSKFNFDLSAQQMQRSSSKTDQTPARSSPAVPEKNETFPINLSPYGSLLSARQTPGRATSPPVNQRLKSPSFDSIVTTSNTSCTTSAPYLSVKFSEEQLNSADKQVTPQLRASMSLDTQGPVEQKQPVSDTLKYISNARNTENTSSRITLSPSKPTAPVSTFESKFHKKNEKLAGTDSDGKASPTQSEKKSHQPNQPGSVTQKVAKQESKDLTDSQSQKWSIFTSKNQRDGSSRGKENKPQTQPVEKTKRNSVGNRMDQMLDRLKSFTIKYREDDVSSKAEDTSLHQKVSSSESSVLENQKRLETCGQSTDKQVHPPSGSNIVGGLGLFIQDQVATKPPKPQKKNEAHVSLLKVPQPTGDYKAKPEQKQKSGHVNQSATLPASWRTETNVSDCSLFKVPQPKADYRTNRLQKQKSIHVNQYATLPASWRTSRVSSSPSSPIDFYKEDVKSNRYFSNASQPRRKTTSLCEQQDDHRMSSALDEEGWLLRRDKLSPCSDIKYGLNQNRSFSVSSVQSGRPSGTGRISRSSSRASSISDLTSAAELMTLDDPVTQEITLNTDDSCGGKSRALQIGPKNESPNRVWSPTSLEKTTFPWENECDPTPPPSPTFSPTTRRLSHAPSSSSQGSWTSQDNISPRGHLPSKNYTCSLSVFEESDSDSSTTDDEYYLDNENGEETEL